MQPDISIDPYDRGSGPQNGRIAGFGLPKRTGTPEPWVRRLADDGLSYFYLNKLDGSVQWTLPESTPIVHVNGRTPIPGAHAQSDPVVQISPPPLSRNRSDSAYARTGSNGGGISNGNVYSDDSDVEPHDKFGVNSTHQPNSVHAADSQTSLQPTLSYDPTQSRPSLVTDTSDPHFTSAERLAQALQHSLAPPPPDSVTALSALTRQSVAAIVTAVQSHDPSNQPSAQASLENRIAESVVAIRHLLYISSPPYGHVPSHLYPRDGTVSSPSIPQSLQVQLKPAQRRVTATLSKLVLAALAAQYDTKSFTSEVSERMETDAAELDRALVTFVTEVQKINGQVPHEPSRRLSAILLPTNVGLGLMGAGAAGGWKGFGWVGTDAQRQPRLDLSTDVLAELKAAIAQLEEKLVDLHSVVFEGGEGESLIYTYAALSHTVCSPSGIWSRSDRDCVAALGAVALCGCEPCTYC